ncbi:MAG: hypothetical protein JWM43_654 [Acidobacteriaceae bacterium]|nr:hypothetical protein [Acidobacteriaceae bacterium]
MWYMYLCTDRYSLCTPTLFLQGAPREGTRHRHSSLAGSCFLGRRNHLLPISRKSDLWIDGHKVLGEFLSGARLIGVDLCDSPTLESDSGTELVHCDAAIGVARVVWGRAGDVLLQDISARDAGSLSREVRRLSFRDLRVHPCGRGIGDVAVRSLSVTVEASLVRTSPLSRMMRHSSWVVAPMAS